MAVEDTQLEAGRRRHAGLGVVAQAAGRFGTHIADERLQFHWRAHLAHGQGATAAATPTRPEGEGEPAARATMQAWWVGPLLRHATSSYKELCTRTSTGNDASRVEPREPESWYVAGRPVPCG